MNIPAQELKENMIDDKNNFKFMNEYKINFDNIIYHIKIGKIINEIEELIIFVKNENIIDTCYYQNNFSLENLQKLNKIFRQFDTIDETIDTLKDLISENHLTIKKDKDKLIITFKFKKLGKGEEEINLILIKNNIEVEKIIDNFISITINLKSEVDKLKNQIKSTKIKKYTPKLENGWIVDPNTPQEFFVVKNKDGQVSFQGALGGDWSKKIFTLEKEYRTKYRLAFPVIANQAFNRVDILPNGDVYLSCHGSLGIQGNGWVNFTGITYYINE